MGFFLFSEYCTARGMSTEQCHLRVVINLWTTLEYRLIVIGANHAGHTSWSTEGDRFRGCRPGTDILQYRLRFGFSLLYKTVFHLNSLTAQLSYEGRVAVEGANWYF
jgi:hypothetical protein